MAPEIMQLQKYDAKVTFTVMRSLDDMFMKYLLLTLISIHRQISGVLVPFYFSL
jgi:hypothetical protein